MARKPVHLTAKARHPQGRQVIWEAIRRLRRFRVTDIEGETRIKHATLKTYLQGLTNAGYLKQVDDPELRVPDARYQPIWWELVNDIGVEAPRVTKSGAAVTQGRGREQMWRTMRIIGDFSTRELAVQASTEQHTVKDNEAKDYCHHLARAGYLLCTQPGRPCHPGRYRLLPSRYSGPHAPQIQRIKQVFDPNLQKVVWRPEEAGDE